MEWLSDPQAGFVVAAYGVAAAGLVGLFLVSVVGYRKWLEKEQKIRKEDA